MIGSEMASKRAARGTAFRPARQPKNIGIEKREKVHDQAGNDRPAGIAQSVTYFFTEG
jgi:hypothetical protein